MTKEYNSNLKNKIKSMKDNLDLNKYLYIEELMEDEKFFYGDLNYKLDIHNLTYKLSKCEYILKGMTSDELRLLGWSYYKDILIIDYNNNLKIKAYNKILYLINSIIIIFKKEGK
jgi:hypothetical protein